MYANGVKMYQFKARNSEIKPCLLGLNISKGVSVDNMKKTGLDGKLFNFLGSFEIIDASDILNIHNYLMKNIIMCRCIDSLSKGLLFW